MRDYYDEDYAIDECRWQRNSSYRLDGYGWEQPVQIDVRPLVVAKEEEKDGERPGDR